MAASLQAANRYGRQVADISEHSQIAQIIRQDTVPWYRKPQLRLLYLSLVPAVLMSEITSGIDSSMLTGLQAVTEWNDYFDQPSGATLGLMSSAYALGSFLSLPLITIIMDRYGRKFAIIVACIWITVGAAIQGASVNIGMFVFARVFMGFGLPTLLTSSAALLHELVYPKHRPTIASFLSVSYYPGAIIGSGITLSTFARTDTWAWRIPSLCQAIPPLVQLCFIWFIPESPRWLVFKGRTEEAHAILAKYHAEGDRDHPLVRAEHVEIVRNIELEMNNNGKSWKVLFTTRANRWRCALAVMVGFYSQFSGYKFHSPSMVGVSPLTI